MLEEQNIQKQFPNITIKMTNLELLNVLYTFLKNSQQDKKNITQRIVELKKQIEGEPYQSDYEDVKKPFKNNRSKIVIKDGKRIIKWIRSNIIQPFTKTNELIKLFPTKEQDLTQIQKLERLLNLQLTRQIKRFKFFKDAITIYLEDGIVIAKVGWKLDKRVKIVLEEKNCPKDKLEAKILELKQKYKNDYNVEYIINLEEKENNEVNIQVKQIKIISNRPDVILIPFEDIYPDFNADNIQDGEFVIHRQITTLSDLRRKDKNYFPDDEYAIYQNVDDIAKSLTFLSNVNYNDDGDVLREYRKYLKYIDNIRLDFSYPSDLTDYSKIPASEKVLKYDFWGKIDIDKDGILEDVHIEFSGDVILNIEYNPYPDGLIPFISTSFDNNPFSLYGDTIMSLIEDIQKIRTALMRQYIDNIAFANNQNYIVKKGSLDAINLQRLKMRQAGDVIESIDPASLIPLPHNPLPAIHYQMYEFMQNEIENSTGFTRYNQGLDPKSISRATATSVQIASTNSQKRLWEYTMNFAENFVIPIAKMFILLNKQYIKEYYFYSEIEDKFFNIDFESIDPDVDIIINIAIEGFNDIKAQQVIQLLQIANPLIQSGIVNPEILQLLYKELIKLWDFKDIAYKFDKLITQQTMQQLQQQVLQQINQQNSQIIDINGANYGY